MTRLFLALCATILLSLPARAAVDIQEVTSPGGITAWLVEEPSIPFTALELRFRGGTNLDREGKRGAVNLMTGLLEEGAADLDARGFAVARDNLAASFDFDSYDDAVSISARFLSENRDDALALLRTALVEPRFDQDALDRVRAQVLAGIRSDLKDPDEIASNAFNAIVYGDHPYGTNDTGTVETVTALTRDDILQAHQDVLARSNLYVSAVGDITADKLGVMLDELLGTLPEEAAPLPPRVEIATEGDITVVPYDTPQSVAIFGHRGIDQDHPDFFAAFILNNIFGASGFESRLMTEVREKRGLTYGIYSFLVSKDLAEVMVGQLASSNERMPEAIEVVKAEWARVQAEGVTAEEVEAAKTYLTGAYPLRFDGNGRIANILVGMQMTGLPIDYAETRNDRINAVPLEEINRVASELMQPDALRFVVVGQPEGLASTN
ncbi:pitrilysin family protein [Cognatishimia sp. MH4019]|uniref:M16 family metallopeptidase n=1 Tax=Cognatishimia sp. MH4019 TaxID=2854030 RepID=UPI001CD1B232|nr:pitrilysin family protein [Cognatishimia sp. MH4019]